ncbi:DNA repair protein RecO [sulfur-oxidizing endosymbiont of Gigantopelta aegis]|uniref:DNA repair protein RecO n=1 Tax=sulfur-oxidizing endosymbiont of Gigantopelta aegis TaxID=2794934 RepID=UPI0018DB5C9C|nr:DNA repair protein RecO [sulfur-oxidizing endosymbiont of Gigantopelta aegis]
MHSRVVLDDKTAIVLHSYSYRDSSVIVNLFLQDVGKVSAIARGIKGNKGKSAKNNQVVLLQPFQKLKISLVGKGDLLTLKSVELCEESDNSLNLWRLSGKSLYCAYYLNELLLRLLPTHSDCTEIFELYIHIISLFSQSSNKKPQQQSQHASEMMNLELPLRLFELKLLEYLGYGLNFELDINTGSSIESHKNYHYFIDAGPTENPLEGTKSLLISGKTLLNLSQAQLNDQKTLQESKQLLKWALAEQLGSQPLKSREMFKQLYC